MSKITFSLFGKEYTVNCGEGEEERLREIVDYVEGKTHEVLTRAGNATEHRLLMLTCLLLADEALNSRREPPDSPDLDNEALIVAAVEHLKNRVAHIASQVGRA